MSPAAQVDVVMRTHGRLPVPTVTLTSSFLVLLAPTRRLAVAGGPAAPTDTARHATDRPTAGGCTLATSLNAAARVPPGVGTAPGRASDSESGSET
jgi:hypothetical protein